MKHPLWILLFITTSTFAQKYITQKSKVTFFSEALLENIAATNVKATGILNVGTSEFAFSIPIKDFEFAKSLMKEHFNEKYMETEKFPKGTFIGKLSDFDSNSADLQKVTAIGKLTIHGVTRDVSIPGTIQKLDASYSILAKFPVKLVDHKITIPELMFQKIAEQVEVTTEFTMKLQ